LIFLKRQLSKRQRDMSFKIKVSFKGSDFDVSQRTVDLKCPHCQVANSVTLAQMQRGEAITCVGCKRTFNFTDKDKSLAKTVSRANDVMSDLKKTLENLGR
jgi:Zn ribbon nucleic-acid-binding protein